MKCRISLALFAASLVLLPMAATASGDPILGPFTLTPIYAAETLPLSELAEKLETAPQGPTIRREIQNPRLDLRTLKDPAAASVPRRPGFDPVRQSVINTPLPGNIPPPSLSFDGISDYDNGVTTGFLIVPPDTNGDIGRDHYVQMNNIVFEVFSAKDGSSVIGPLPNNIFFSGSGTACGVFNDGDPIILYDHRAKRWIFSQFAVLWFNGFGYVSSQCFAVSKTHDPLGAYYVYEYVAGEPLFGNNYASLNDYPKLSIWTDGIYYTANDFECGDDCPNLAFTDVSAIAFDKEAMYAGDPQAKGIKFVLGPVGATDEIYYSLLSSHWEGERTPPPGQPNTFIQMWDSEQFTFSGDTGPDGVLAWDFYARFDEPDSSEFVPRGLIPQPEFESWACDSRNCVDQPAPGRIADGDGVDGIDFRLMYKAYFRTFGDEHPDGPHDSIVGAATVDADGDFFNQTIDVGVRWFELRRTGGNWWTHQSGTYAPDDGSARFMPSIAINSTGAIALGFTTSGVGQYPSVNYAFRRADTPLGLMYGEETCQVGSGSQIESLNRWGDYSSMSVDPKDDCTFWYSNEYYETTDSFDFKTRICSINPCLERPAGDVAPSFLGGPPQN